MARKLYRRISFLIVHRILRADDSPSRIGRGVAIGVFMAWLPLIGLQMLLVLAFSFILRANKLVGLPVVWISNIFTLGPIYYPSYIVGTMILKLEAVSIKAFEHRFGEIFSSGLPWTGQIREFASVLFGEIIYPTFIGSLITGAIMALLSYFLTVWAIDRHRRHRISRRAKRLSRVPEQIKQRPSAEPNQISGSGQRSESKVG